MIEQILQADRYLQVDQVDKARDVYQRVVDADPGNAIAVVGLARCALADGDDARAYELAGRALEIDPENEMARRMEARLSEILANRGEAVQRPDAASTANPYEMRPVVTTDDTAADDPSEAASPAAVAPDAEPDAPAAATTETSSSATPAGTASTPPPKPTVAAKEPPVRKSLFDRLMGR